MISEERKAKESEVKESGCNADAVCRKGLKNSA